MGGRGGDERVVVLAGEFGVGGGAVDLGDAAEVVAGGEAEFRGGGGLGEGGEEGDGAVEVARGFGLPEEQGNGLAVAGFGGGGGENWRGGGDEAEGDVAPSKGRVIGGREGDGQREQAEREESAAPSAGRRRWAGGRAEEGGRHRGRVILREGGRRECARCRFAMSGLPTVAGWRAWGGE